MKTQTNNQKIFFYLGLFLVVAFFAFPKVSYAATSVTQHGITWTFDGDYAVGQFVNGDYYVIDPGDGVKIINISPGYTDTPRAMNGSMINPVGQLQGYDAANSYDATKNVGIGISELSPLNLTADNSLVSTISNPTGIENNSSYIKTAVVLTCLSSVPPSGTFRPGVGSPRKPLFNESNLNWSLLKKLPVPSGQTITASTFDTYANCFQMTWVDHNGKWSGRYLHPIDSGMSNYYYAPNFADAALLLHLDFSNEEKERLLINYIQLGLDLYSYIDGGLDGWGADGGHGPGRKWPILFAGLVLNDADMKNIGQISGDYLYSNGHGPGNPPDDYIRFGEDSQTFYVKQFDVDLTNGPTWNPDTRSAPNYPYTNEMIGMPEWGIKYDARPQDSDAQWSTNYRTNLNNNPSFTGASMAARIMGAKTLWNHDALFDYVDRYMAISGGNEDPFGYVVPTEVAQNRPGYLIGAMYDTYRADYPNQPNFRADVDGSSGITTTDALLTLRNSLRLSMNGTAWRSSTKTGDVNCDGVSNSTDALLILRFSLGLSMSGTEWCEQFII